MLQVTQEGLKVAAMMAFPLLLTSLLIGLVIGFFQSMTQIQEVSLNFVPKLLILSVVAVLLYPWMSEVLLNFTRSMLEGIPNYIKGGVK